MTDVKKTAYLAEAQTALSSDLDADTDNTWSGLSAEFDNSTNGYMFMDIEVYLASASFTGADSAYEIYVVPSLDGANYPTTINSGTADEQENNQYFVGSITTTGVSQEVQRQVIRGVEVPNGKWKMFARNRTNDGLTSTNDNTVKWRPWGYKSA